MRTRYQSGVAPSRKDQEAGTAPAQVGACPHRQIALQHIAVSLTHSNRSAFLSRASRNRAKIDQ